MSSVQLLAAAQLERDRRAESYPAKIQAGADAEALTIDYQCWVAIAEWVETGRFLFFHGGANPGGAAAPFIRWAELEAAAARGLAKVNGKIDALETAPKPKPETLGALRHRRSCLFAIHHQLQRTREQIDIINAHFNREKEIA